MKSLDCGRRDANCRSDVPKLILYLISSDMVEYEQQSLDNLVRGTTHGYDDAVMLLT
jgi:hypothetical protein